MFQCGFEKPTDEEKVKRQITVDHRSENSLWFTITDGEGRIVGETGLLRMFPAWHQTDLTIIIPDPQMQRKGYGTEAMEIMLDLAFHEYKMHCVSIGVASQGRIDCVLECPGYVYIGVAARNTSALKFYKKMGFRQGGVLEEAYYYKGAYSDFVMMRILSRDWR